MIWLALPALAAAYWLLALIAAARGGRLSHVTHASELFVQGHRGLQLPALSLASLCCLPKSGIAGGRAARVTGHWSCTASRAHAGMAQLR